MKRVLCSLILFSFAAFSPDLSASGRPAAGNDICPPSHKLPEHESLVYRVRWLGVNIGTIRASIKGIKTVHGRSAYELEMTARTNDLLSRIYPVNDRYVSYLDAEKLRTLRHEVYRREGRYKKDAVTDFDYASGRAHFMNLLDRSEKTVIIPPDVQDPVSVAYLFRISEIRLCETKVFNVYNNEEVYLLSVMADSKKPVRIPKTGPMEAFRVRPYAELNGKAVKKGRAGAYFSCGAKRIPLLGSVRAPLFTEITAHIEEGL